MNRKQKAWQVLLYHDEPEEASADTDTLDLYFDEKQAINGARRHLTDYWQTASIHVGEYTPPGWRSPGHFEDDEEATPIRVGKGWVER